MATDPSILQFQADIRALSQSMQALAAANGRTASAVDANRETFIDLSEEVGQYEQQLKKNRKLTKDQEALLKKASEARKREIEIDKQLLKLQADKVDAEKKSKKDQAQIDRLNKNIAFTQGELAKANKTTKGAAQELEDSFVGVAKKTDWVSAALVYFGSTLATQGKQLVSQYKTSGGVIEGSSNIFGSLLEQQNKALTLGLTGNELATISKEARQTINAMGGTSAAFSAMTPAIDNFRAMTLNSAEAAKLAAGAAQYFAQSGVKPTAVNIEQYRKSLVQLTAQTGMSTDQAAAYYDELAKDADTVELMRTARKGERQAILDNQRAQIANSIALGMTAEQAKQASKMLASMVAQKPIDRLKQAARIRALGGAMGIGGANEAANDLVAGRQNSQALKDFSIAAANARDSAKDQGLASEIFTSQLYDKLDLDKYYGKGTPFSTTLGDSLAKPLSDINKTFTDAAMTAQGQAAQLIAKTAEQVKIALSGEHWLGVIAGGVAVIAAFMMKDTLTKGAGKIGEKLAEKFGANAAKGEVKAAETFSESVAKMGDKIGVAKGAGTALPTIEGAAKAGGGIADGAAGEAKAASGALSKLGGAAKALGSVAKVLGPVAGVAVGVLDAKDEYDKNGKAGAAVGTGVGSAAGGIAGGWAGAAGGAALGAAVGSVVPILGTAVGGVVGGILGAIGGGWGGSAAGGAAGKAIGSKFDKQDGLVAPDQAPQLQSKDPKLDMAKKAQDTNSDIKDATVTSATGITAQLKKMDTQQDILQLLATLTQKQVDLAEKTLVAVTLTDKEKQDRTSTRELRKDNKFASQYNYA